MTYRSRDKLPDADPSDLKFFSRELESMVQDPTEKYAPPLLVTVEEGEADSFVRWTRDNLKQHERSDPTAHGSYAVYNLITIEKSIPVICNHESVESVDVDRAPRLEI